MLLKILLLTITVLATYFYKASAEDNNRIGVFMSVFIIILCLGLFTGGV